MKEYNNNDFLCITGKYDNILDAYKDIKYQYIEYDITKGFNYDIIFRPLIYDYLNTLL
jgi:hypothetical protein